MFNLDECIEAGQGIPLIFTATDEKGEAIDLADCEITWNLCKYGQVDYSLIKKDNKSIGGITVLTNGQFKVDLMPSDTYSLRTGKYIHGYSVKRSTGDVHSVMCKDIPVRQGIQYNS